MNKWNSRLSDKVIRATVLFFVQLNAVTTVSLSLGRGYPVQTIIASLCLTVIVIFYITAVSSFFEPDIYFFEDRVTYHRYFEQKFIVNHLADYIIILIAFCVCLYLSFKNEFNLVLLIGISLLLIVYGAFYNITVLHIISVISLPSIMILITLSRIFHLKFLHYELCSLAPNYLLYAVLILSAFSIFISVSGLNISDHFIDIMSVLSRFSPIIMFLIVFSVVLNPSINLILRELSKSFRLFSRTDAFLASAIYSFTESRTDWFRRKSKLLLISSMLLAILIVIIPHFDGGGSPISEDTQGYVNWLSEMESTKDLTEFLDLIFVKILNGDRPLSLLTIYGLSYVSPFDALVSIDFLLPLFLAPLLTLLIYFMTRQFVNNESVALFASLITPISFQVLIGLYGGFYANWLALLPSYIAIATLSIFLRTSNKIYLSFFSISLTLVLFAHVYTWTIITVFLVIFLGVLLWRKLYNRKLIILAFLIISSVVGIDLLRSFITGSSAGIEQDLSIAEERGAGLKQFELRWDNLVRTVQVYLGGIYSNPVMLYLSLYATIFLLNLRSLAGLFVILFISVAIIPLLFGNVVIMSRILYEIPFQIPAAFALAHIYSFKKGRFLSVVLAICLLSLGVYTASNLGQVIPSED